MTYYYNVVLRTVAVVRGGLTGNYPPEMSSIGIKKKISA